MRWWQRSTIRSATICCGSCSSPAIPSHPIPSSPLEVPHPLEVPRGAELAARLASVLEAIYLIFNEGYSATAGQGWVRPALCEDALRLGRVLAGLMPEEAEVLGLVALMEIQASRLRARTTARRRVSSARMKSRAS